MADGMSACTSSADYLRLLTGALGSPRVGQSTFTLENSVTLCKVSVCRNSSPKSDFFAQLKTKLDQNSFLDEPFRYSFFILHSNYWEKVFQITKKN